MSKVNIQRIALGQLIASAFAALRVETCGIVCGKMFQPNGSRMYVVEAVQAYQLVERKPAKVTPNNGEELRLKHLLNQIGGFHSHLTTPVIENGKRMLDHGRVRLSKSDREYMDESYPDGIEIVVALRRTKRASDSYIDQTRVGGCFSYKDTIYRVDMGAYYLNAHRNKRRATLQVSKKDLTFYLNV